jgi:hypothetical protein
MVFSCHDTLKMAMESCQVATQSWIMAGRCSAKLLEYDPIGWSSHNSSNRYGSSSRYIAVGRPSCPSPPNCHLLWDLSLPLALLCWSSHCCITRVLVSIRDVFKHLHWYPFTEIPEVQRLFNFPRHVLLSFRHLEVEIIGNNNCQAFPMQHWWIPVLPWPIKNPRIFNKVINRINAWVGSSQGTVHEHHSLQFPKIFCFLSFLSPLFEHIHHTHLEHLLWIYYMTTLTEKKCAHSHSPSCLLLHPRPQSLQDW